MSLPICRWTLTFQEWTRVVSRSEGNEMNGPLRENGALASNSIGNGLGTLVPAKTSLNGPMSGRVRRTSEPHGGAFAALMKNCPLTNSLFIPYPARTDMRPAPLGFQSIPMRRPDVGARRVPDEERVRQRAVLHQR